MKNPPDNPKLTYSIREVCAATSLGRSTIYKAIFARQLDAVRIGNRRLIPAESLHAFLRGKA